MLPDSWIAKIFEQMSAMYGSKFTALWSGTDACAVKTIWAEKLGGFKDKPQAIKAALNALDDHPFPPTLPEFLTLCRNAARRIESSTAAIEYKPTAEDASRHREMSNKAKQALKPKISDGIDTHWATHPRSVMHLKFILDAEKKDQRFAPCVAEMVADGICTEDGHLLKSYRDQQFHRVNS